MSASVLEPSQDEVTDLAENAHRLIERYLHEINVEAHISKKTIVELAYFFYRDIYRIKVQQNDHVTAAKFAGYLGFWIRKLKPISEAFNIGANKEDPNLEIIEINELAALQIAINVLIQDGKGGAESELHDPVRRNCQDNTCDGKVCLTEYIRLYFGLPTNVDYILYSMRHRTFGPHHLVNSLEHLVFGACKFARGGGLINAVIS